MTIMSSTARARLGSWLAAGTGLDGGAIVLSGQGGRLPKDDDGVRFPTWIAVNIIATAGVGTEWDTLEANPLELADDVVETVSAAANTLTLTGHAYQTGDGPINLTTTGTLPAGVVVATDYWLVVVDVDTVKLTASRAAAVAEVPSSFVDITDAGTGVHTIVDTEDTRRVLAEVKRTIEGHRSATLSVQCFADEVLDEGSAAAVLEKLRASRIRWSQILLLREAGLAVATMGPVGGVGGSKTGLGLTPRATMTVTMNYIDSVTEELPQIDSVEADLDVVSAGDDELATETFTVE